MSLLTCIGAVSKVKHAMCDGAAGKGQETMHGRIQTRLALLGALAALVAVLVPSGLAFGSHGEDPVVTTGEASFVYLTTGKQDNIQWSAGTENIVTAKNDCSVVNFVTPPDLLTITPGGGSLGFVKDGFGVQSPGDGAGEPCGRAEAVDGETLAVSLGSTLDNYLMTAIDVDIEMKFNAILDIIFYHDGNEVDRVPGWTGMGGSDDGPDSKDLDNFRFNSENNNTKNITGEYFDTVMFVPTSGAISLEGGADGTDPNTLGGVNNPYGNTPQVDESRSSVFRIQPVADGEITCGPNNGITIENPALTDAVADVIMRSLSLNGDPYDSNCTYLKPYTDSITDELLTFIPDEPESPARYTMTVVIPGQEVSSDPTGVITTLKMQYSANGLFTDTATLQSCNTVPPTEDDDPVPDPADYAAFWTESPELLIPGTSTFFFPEESPGVRATACFYDVQFKPTGVDGDGNTIGTETWKIAFEADPGIAWR